jgi:nucleotide-binding universal stress UspA family protein
MLEVLACVDFSDATTAVVAEAAFLARGLGCSLYIIHVAAEEPTIAGYDKDPVGAYTRDDRAHELLDERHHLRELAQPLEDEGLTVLPLLVMGSTVDKILEEAERVGAGHIVVGSHGHGGLFHVLLGSVSESVVRASTVPVVVVPVRR